MKLHLGVYLVAALGLVACNGGGGGEGSGTATETDTGDETGTDSGEPRTEVPFDEFHEAAEEAFCKWQVACHQYGVEARCRSVNHMELRLSMRRLSGVGTQEAAPRGYLKEAVDIGRIAYDEKAAAACLDYVAARTCEYDFLHVFTAEEQAGRDACAAVFKGRMGRNGPCMAANECAEEAICGFDPNATEECAPGACRVLAQPAKLGEACTFNAGCEQDSFCEQDVNTGQPTVCVAAPKAGQACNQGVCAGGAFCEFDFENGTQTCVKPRPVGAACNSDYECEQPGICRYTEFEGGRCFKPAEEGGACDWNGYGIQCLRFDNYCAPNNTCKQLPGKGENCVGECAGDFFCSQLQGAVCTPVADAEERCGWDENYYQETPCSGDNYCDYVPETDRSVCVEPVGTYSCSVPEDPLAG